MIAIKHLVSALERTGKTKTGLATHLGLRNSAITEILGGDRTIKADELPLIHVDAGTHQVRIEVPDGKVAAGSKRRGWLPTITPAAVRACIGREGSAEQPA